MQRRSIDRPTFPNDPNQTRAGASAPRGLLAATAGLALALIVSACNAQSFQPSKPPAMPTPPPAPAQPPPPPLNPARMLNGNWSASYPGGPLQVVIGLDPRLRGRNYVATLATGNPNMPAGTVAWNGTVDPSVPGLIIADQICAEPGFLQAKTVKARLTVSDPSHMVEELVRPRDCHGYPVKWTRVGPAPTRVPLAE